MGKSSLINNLCERKKLVRTSSTPGCTRGINLFEVRLRPKDGEEDALLDLVDLPGYGFVRRSKAERKSWGPLMETFLAERPGLRGVVVIVDVRRGLEPDDQQLVEYLHHIGRTPIIVGTKVDKVPKSKSKLAVVQVQKQVDAQNPNEKIRVLGFSSQNGLGRVPLWNTILRVAAIGG